MCTFCHSRPLVPRRDAQTCGASDCLQAYDQARRLRYYHERERAERVYHCQACDAVIVVPAGTKSGPRSLCDACRSIGSKVSVVRRRLQGDERYICPCGRSFARPQTKGQRPRYCPSCAAGRGWKRLNPGARRRSDAKRRARLAIEAESFAPEEIFERDRWRCGICRRAVNRRLRHPHPRSPSLDHVVPLAEGGHHVRSNVRLAHLICNTSRGARGGNEQLLLIG